MLSLSLGLPEFKVIKHDQFADDHLISVEKNASSLNGICLKIYRAAYTGY